MNLFKTKQGDFGMLYCKNRVDVYPLKTPLYGNYYLTDQGIFKFVYTGYHIKAKCRMFQTVVILPMKIPQGENEYGL